MQKKIYLYLCGGLGNQLFQYAAAKNLAIKNKSELILDVGTSFSFFSQLVYAFSAKNFKTFLSFSLNKQKLKNVKFRNYIFVFWFYRLLKKIFNLKKKFNNFYDGMLVNEMFLTSFEKKIKNFVICKNLYLFGYFQSEKYFYENKRLIIKELMPKKSTNQLFLRMQKKINLTNSVSIGLRLYEEQNIKSNNKIGGIIKLNFFRLAVIKILKYVKKPEFFIFSTTNNNINKLLLECEILKKYKINFITEDEGYAGSMDNLWLMSQFKYHIISNSSLYWWAAYFSQDRYKNGKIISTSNFANKDTCLYKWKL